MKVVESWSMEISESSEYQEYLYLNYGPLKISPEEEKVLKSKTLEGKLLRAVLEAEIPYTVNRTLFENSIQEILNQIAYLRAQASEARRIIQEITNKEEITDNEAMMAEVQLHNLQGLTTARREQESGYLELQEPCDTLSSIVNKYFQNLRGMIVGLYKQTGGGLSQDFPNELIFRKSEDIERVPASEKMFRPVEAVGQILREVIGQKENSISVSEGDKIIIEQQSVGERQKRRRLPTGYTWEEIFQNPEIYENKSLVQGYRNAVTGLIENLEGRFSRFVDENGNVSQLAAMEEILILTPSELNQSFNPDTKTRSNLPSATKIVCLIYRFVSGEFVPSDQLEEFTNRIRSGEYKNSDPEKTIFEILEHELFPEGKNESETTIYEQQDQDIYAPKTRVTDTQPLQDRNEQLRNTAIGIIKEARNKFGELATAESMTLSFPMVNGQMDKLLGGAANIRHVAEELGYIKVERGSERKIYTELEAIIVYTCKKFKQRYQDSRRMRPIITAIINTYEGEFASQIDQ